MLGLRSLLAIVLLALASACGRYFPPDIHLPRHATPEEIVGTWNFAEHTLGIAKRDGYVARESTSHQIVFRSDGTCDFKSITEFGRKADTGTSAAHGSSNTTPERRARRRRRMNWWFESEIAVSVSTSPRIRGVWFFGIFGAIPTSGSFFAMKNECEL